MLRFLWSRRRCPDKRSGACVSRDPSPVTLGPGHAAHVPLSIPIAPDRRVTVPLAKPFVVVLRKTEVASTATIGDVLVGGKFIAGIEIELYVVS